MDHSFELLLRQGDSVIAANAIARSLAERRKLQSQEDVEAFLDFAVDGSLRARAVALTGLSIIERTSGVKLSALRDRDADEYVRWLSEFALNRAARGLHFSRARGEALLTEMRNVRTTSLT